MQSSWRNSLVILVAFPFVWWFFGWILAASFFDSNFFEVFKLLPVKGDAIGYIALLFAAQIPLLILLLQTLFDSGLIIRFILPKIIYFRELLTSYVWLSFWLVLSPRSSYFYVPVGLLTILSLYSVYITVKVLFDQRQFKKREDEYVSSGIARAFDSSMKDRASINDFLEKTKLQPMIDYTFGIANIADKNLKVLEIRSDKSGVVGDINVDGLSELMAQTFSSVSAKNILNSTKEDTRESTEKLLLMVRPRSVVKRGGLLMKLIVLHDTKTPSLKFINRLKRAINFSSLESNTSLQELNDWIADLKQQLRNAVNSDDILLMQQSFQFYGLLLKSSINFGEEDHDSNYTLQDAQGEFNGFVMDDAAQQVRAIASIIDDEFVRAVRGEKQDSANEIVGFIGHDQMDVLEELDPISIARSEHSLSFAITCLIYAESRNIMLSPFHYQLFDNLIFKLVEHTGLLLYTAQKQDYDISEAKVLRDWIELRISNMRAFLIGAYKVQRSRMFMEIFKICERFENQYRFPEGSDDNVPIELFRASLFAVTAYMSNSASKTDEQRECLARLTNYIQNWDSEVITKVLIDCIDRQYVDAWRLDSFDLDTKENGKVYTVPDFNTVLKDLWLDYMLQKGNTDPSYYRGLPIATTLTFTGGLDSHTEPYLLRKLKEYDEVTYPRVGDLRLLIESFISQRRAWETTELAAKSLSAKKVEEFRRGVIEGYLEQSVSIKIFEAAQKIQTVATTRGNYLNYGFNELKDKAAFIENWHYGYFMPGDQYGNEIAKAEDQHLIGKLLDMPVPVENINVLLATLRRKKNTKWVIIGRNIGDWAIMQNPEIGKFVTKQTNNREVFFKKINQLLSVQYIYDQTNEKGIYAISVSDLGTLKVKEYLNNDFLEVSVNAYSHNKSLLNEILQSPPDWLKEKGDETRQIEFLMTKVRMLISHAFYHRKHSSARAYILRLEDKDLW